MDYCDLRYGPAAMLVDTEETFWFLKKWDFPGLTEQLLAVQEGLCCVLGDVRGS